MCDVETKPSYDSEGFHVIYPSTNLLMGDVWEKLSYDFGGVHVNCRCGEFPQWLWGGCQDTDFHQRWMLQICSLLRPSQMQEPLRSAADDFPEELVLWLYQCSVSSCFVQLVWPRCKQGGIFLPGCLRPSVDQRCASTNLFIVVEQVLGGSNYKLQCLAETSAVQALVSMLWLDLLVPYWPCYWLAYQT